MDQATSVCFADGVESPPTRRPQRASPVQTFPDTPPFPPAMASPAVSPLVQPIHGGPEELMVPLVHPRYQRKERHSKSMSVTDSESEGALTGASLTESLRKHTEETLRMSARVAGISVTHTEAVRYHNYAMYRHGARAIVTDAVGYSSDGDLVLHKFAVSELSDSGSSANMMLRRGVDHLRPMCLNPKARARSPMTDTEVLTRRQKQRLQRMKKYPGVPCPRSKKERNRLFNDHFVGSAVAREVYAAAIEKHDEDVTTGVVNGPRAPTFDVAAAEGPCEQAVRDGRLPDDEATAFAKRQAARAATEDRASAPFRFRQLSARLRSELQHAMSTDFMPLFIHDLEERVAALLRHQDSDAAADRSIEVACRDGYGRLITHGVAGYYKLASQSVTNAEDIRVTLVQLPAKGRRVEAPRQTLLSYLKGEGVVLPPEGLETEAPVKQKNVKRRVRGRR